MIRVSIFLFLVNFTLRASPLCDPVFEGAALYAKLSLLFPSAEALTQAINKTSLDFGIPRAEVVAKMQRLANNPALMRYMRGVELLPPGQTLTMVGGWGAERLLVPQFLQAWGDFLGRAPEVLQRYGQKLKFDDPLISELEDMDVISAMDSGWIVLLSGPYDNIDYSKPPASLKIVHFDPSMPTGYLDDRFVRPINDPELAKFKTALEDWGLLPLERHTGWRIPEHDSAHYDKKYADMFSPAVRKMHGKIMFKTLFDAMNTPAIIDDRAYLLNFRKQNFPKAALSVAELNRFNIPPGMRQAGAKAQLFFALLALMKDRDIDVLYLEAPIVDPNPKRDLHRLMYENLGFEVVKTFGPESTPGFKNGAHVMRSAREDLRAKLLQELQKPEMINGLAPEQMGWLTNSL